MLETIDNYSQREEKSSGGGLHRHRNYRKEILEVRLPISSCQSSDWRVSDLSEALKISQMAENVASESNWRGLGGIGHSQDDRRGRWNVLETMVNFSA